MSLSTTLHERPVIPDPQPAFHLFFPGEKYNLQLCSGTRNGCSSSGCKVLRILYKEIQHLFIIMLYGINVLRMPDIFIKGFGTVY